jgi:hypothetical protein
LQFPLLSTQQIEISALLLLLLPLQRLMLLLLLLRLLLLLVPVLIFLHVSAPGVPSSSQLTEMTLAEDTALVKSSSSHACG